jgi:hypothetical protein
MALETVILKVPELHPHTFLHRHDWLCPKCEGHLSAVPSHTPTFQNGPSEKKSIEIEMEFQVLMCDRCGQIMAFVSCTGECATYPKSICEVCGKYYCRHCGITLDFDVEGRHVELRYCNDHIPEWYKNR